MVGAERIEREETSVLEMSSEGGAGVGLTFFFLGAGFSISAGSSSRSHFERFLGVELLGFAVQEGSHEILFQVASSEILVPDEDSSTADEVGRGSISGNLRASQTIIPFRSQPSFHASNEFNHLCSQRNIWQRVKGYL